MSIYDEMSDMDLARQFLALNRMEDNTTKGWEQMVPTFVTLLKQQAPDASEGVLGDVIGKLQHCLEGMGELMPSVVLKHFDRSELLELIEVHQQPIMQTLVSRLPDLRIALRGAMDGEEMEKIQEALAPLKDLMGPNFGDLGGLDFGEGPFGLGS